MGRNRMKWKYYNHAMIPTTAPNEDPDLQPIKDGTIWSKQNGKIPLLATWTTEFDCKYETNWWYIVKKAPYVFEDLDKRKRKQIRRALDKVKVDKICPTDYIDAIWQVYRCAFDRYNNYDNFQDEEFFKKNIDQSLDWWMAFDVENEKPIGWMTFFNHGEYVTIVSAKYDPEYMKSGTSSAIYDTALRYYLNDCRIPFIESGERSINHETNVQQFKIDTFKFEKAYCKLNVAYNPKIKWIIKMLYPFRRIIKKFDNVTLLHQLNSVLLIEEVVRKKNYKRL